LLAIRPELFSFAVPFNEEVLHGGRILNIYR